MSVTEWVLNTYKTEESGLQEAKDFTFIWSLFENQSRNKIFTTDKMRINEFVRWVDKLEVKHNGFSVVIEDKQSGKSINDKLLKNIDKSFNHFYQLYNKDKQSFCNYLFNQEDEYTKSAKSYFENFAESMDKKKIQSKMVFLFHIAKRMRNKFFHGIKSIGEVKADSKEFEKISVYLISILSLIESYD